MKSYAYDCKSGTEQNVSIIWLRKGLQNERNRKVCCDLCAVSAVAACFLYHSLMRDAGVLLLRMNARLPGVALHNCEVMR